MMIMLIMIIIIMIIDAVLFCRAGDHTINNFFSVLTNHNEKTCFSSKTVCQADIEYVMNSEGRG